MIPQPNNLRENKKRLRNRFKELRSQLTPEERRCQTAAIHQRLTGLTAFRECSVLLTYVSIGTEVDTHAVMEAAWAAGKTVAVPLCLPETRSMRFYPVTGWQDLAPGCYGVPEPNPERCPPVTDFSGSLCLVPGLAFDRAGYRMGYGKGYYDRFLGDYCGITVGLAFRESLTRELPRGRFDQPVTLIVTDRGLIRPRTR